MSETSLRMTDPGKPPSAGEVEAWIGQKAYEFWDRIVFFIDQNYPDVFSPEWLYGGKKHGWSLRYKKSRSFCTLIPEKNRFALLIVFGKEEREKVASIRQELSSKTRKIYDEATTYHDGKWVLLTVDTEAVILDAERLLLLKRSPRNLGK